MRTLTYWAISLAVVVILGGLVYQKENLLRTGRKVYLRLARGVSPSRGHRHFLELRYDLEDEVRMDPAWDGAAGGALVLALREGGVGRFIRIHRGDTLAAGEFLLRYRRRKGRLRLGAEMFFFQEGTAEQYGEMRYSELRVAPSGDCVLVGLRYGARTKSAE